MFGQILDQSMTFTFWEKGALSLVIFILLMVFRKMASRYILAFLSKYISRTQNRYDDRLLRAFEKPVRALFVVLSLYAAIHIVHFAPQESRWLDVCFRTVVILLIANGLYQSAPLFTEIGGRLRFKADHILTKFLARTIQFVIIALTITIIAEAWGFDVNGFLAGLGLGGLAIALAAKDSLANLFAGVVIITGKPFSIGDWIKTDSVEGTVEDITLRSTKVRTFEQAVVTVPNANLANDSIINWTKMGKRRVYFHLRVSYRSTREQLETSVEEIKQLLKNHEGVHKETIMVNFDSFGEHGFEILLYFFTNTTSWEEYLAAKQEINFEILGILEREKIEVALPGRSIYLKTPMEVASKTPEDQLKREVSIFK
ncbi:MAG TPA: mechanosensitive ion channel family protein [Bacillales bacterium]|nr:mechanosensitive ion channel family protein [Bacillales bacterium]